MQTLWDHTIKYVWEICVFTPLTYIEENITTVHFTEIIPQISIGMI
jgi:hypothetical protein